MNKKTAALGQRAGWLCFFCGDKVVPQARENHPMHPVTANRTDGKEVLAHLKCTERNKPGAAPAPAPATPTTFRAARENVAAHAAIVAIEDFLDMAEIPPAATTVERVGTVIDQLLELREKNTMLALQAENNRSLIEGAVADKARKLEAEVATLKETLATVTAERDDLVARHDALTEDHDLYVRAGENLRGFIIAARKLGLV